MQYWYWLALGFVLMGIELMLPSFFFMWLGISALVVGGLLFAVPDLPFTVQGTLFAIAAILSFYVSRKIIKTKQGKSHTTLNKRGASLVGEIVVLESAIENGHGKARVGDTLWSVHGPDAPAGSRVKIIGADGSVLKVEGV